MPSTNRKQFFDLMSTYLDKAAALVDQAVRRDETIPDIERDILRDKIRAIYSAISAIDTSQQPLFAPPEPQPEVEAVSKPLMDSVAENPYNDLFTASASLAENVILTARTAQEVAGKQTQLTEKKERTKQEAEQAAIREVAEEAKRKAE